MKMKTHITTMNDNSQTEKTPAHDPNAQAEPMAGFNARLAHVSDIAARTANEIMAQIEFGAPTEKLFALMVRNACMEAIVLANK